MINDAHETEVVDFRSSGCRPTIRIEVIKQIYNICLLPNDHLILEASSMFMPGFEVYDLSLQPCDAANSIRTVETNANDLTAIRYNA